MNERGYIDWKPYSKTKALLDETLSVFEEYADYRPLTVRQVFYRLVGRGVIAKTDLKRVYHVVWRGRRSRLIPFDWVRDDGIVVESGGGYASATQRIAELRREAARRFLIDRQTDQDQFLELWVEAAGMVPQIKRVAREYAIPVYSGGGFVSITGTWQTAQRVVDRKVDTVLLQIGDLDPHGVALMTAFSEDVEAFAEEDGFNRVEAERIVLKPEQVEAHDLPGERVAPRTPLDRAWIAERGPWRWQAEALPPDVLATEVEAAIRAYFDLDVYQQRLEYEKREKAVVRRWAEGNPS
jgi:hypothetical protein